MADLRFDVTALDNASKTFARMAAAVDQLERRLQSLDRQRAEPTIDVDTSKAERNIGKFAADLQQRISKAVAALPDVELNADASDVDRELADVRAKLAALADQRIGVGIDAVEAEQQMRELQARLQRLSDESANVQVSADTASAVAALGVVKAEVDKIDGRKATVKVDVDKSLADSIVKVAALGRALGTLVLPAAALAAAPTLASIGAAAVEASGAIGLLPAAGAAAALGIGTLTVGMHSLADALGPTGTKAQAEKVAAAIAQLAPAARDTVDAIRGLGGAWNDLRLDVQQRLFADLGRSISVLGNTYIPILRDGMARVATAFNEAGRSVAGMLKETSRVGDMRLMVGSLATAWESILKAVAPISAVLVDIGVVGAGVLRGVVGGARDAAVAFAGFIATARESGQLAGWMQAGVEQVRQLGRIARDTGATLLNVFSVADGAGVGFLDTLAQIVARTREWTASAAGQATIAAVFTSIRDAVNAAAPGVERLVTAVASVVRALGDAGVLRAAGEAFSAIATEVAPLIALLGNAAPAVTGFLNVVRDLAPVLVPAAAALAGFWLAAKLVQGISSVTTAVTGFVGSIRSIGSVDDATGKVRTLAGALGAGGVLGLALAAAGVALAIYAGAQANAAQAAADHKARVDELRGTLDQYTGAATQATKAQIAQELGTKKLSDGTTSYASALSSAGVSLADYTDATSGNEQALLKVRGQLDAHVASLMAASPAYKSGAADLKLMGISLDDVAAAAQGNGPALERIGTAVGQLGGPASEAGSAFQLLVDGMIRSAGGAGELGAELNKMAGQFGEAQQQARDAATATRDFGVTLDGIKAGFAGLAAGAQQTDLMRAGLVDLATAARDAAKASGENAAALGGAAEGGKAAAASMQQSRDAFISAATAAGLTADQANALANQIGLIPAVARTNFETNATVATAQINEVGAAFAAVPGSKSVVVQALTQDAAAQLDQIGLRVETLPDGTLRVHADTAVARANLDAFVAAASNTSATIRVGALTLPAQEALTAILGEVSRGAATVTINGQSVPAQAALSYALGLINQSNGTVTVNGQSAPAQQVLSAYIGAINAGRGTVTVNGQDVPARQVLSALVSAVTGSRPAITVNSNAAAVNAAIDNAARNRTTTIQVKYAGVRPASATGIPIPQARGGIVQPMRDGGVIPMAGGGRLSPMRGGVAQVVPPNTWRLVGDRLRDDEAYIPINGSARSRQILGVAAQRMGFNLTPAAGSAGPAAGVYGGVEGQTSGQVQAALSVAGVEKRLDQLVQLIERRGAGATINVHDTSGDPSETARSAMLALRLS